MEWRTRKAAVVTEVLIKIVNDNPKDAAKNIIANIRILQEEEAEEWQARLLCLPQWRAAAWEGKIYIDDKKETISSIVENSWYVGHDIYGSHKPLFDIYGTRNPLLRRKSIREQIIAGVKANHCDLNADIIQNMFELSEPRVGRSIKYMSGVRWKASIAIGYAYGKKIFCYPWMNSYDVKLFGEQITKSIKVLTDNNCTVIFPTTKEENILKLSEKFNIINLN